MVLIGFLAFLDPPKQSAARAIKQLHEYGIEVKILSGDNDAVVQTIARQVGIDTSNALTGIELEAMNEEEQHKAVRETTVFSKLHLCRRRKSSRCIKTNKLQLAS